MRSFAFITLGIGFVVVAFVVGRLSTSVAPEISTVPAPVVAVQATASPIPFQKPSEAELSAAAARARFLNARYGVPETEVATLTKETYDVAMMLSLAESDRTALHAAVLGFAESGGSALRPFGIEGDQLSIARKLGGNSERALIALTKPEIVRAQTLIATQGLASFILHGNQ